MTQPRESGPDPIGDFQRWLVRSGARGMTRELGGHIAGAFRLGGKPGDVWETATAPPPANAPECAWCPVCRAARLLRVSGPGLASQVASASDTLGTLIQEAASVVESALAAGRRPEPGAPADRRPPGWDAEVLPDWDLGSAAGWTQAAQADEDVAGAAGAAERPVLADADSAAAEPADATPSVWAEATGDGADPAANGNGNGATDTGPAPPEPPA
ncbi:MAG: hypothetical protein J2P34_03055 [Actinobacteria bacterium]|nr:hypothetical protein [Actinomycetota bacterium]